MGINVKERFKPPVLSADTAVAIINRLNALPKLEGARKPFGEVAIEKDIHRGGWWVMCEKKLYDGFSFHYSTLAVAVRSWDIRLTEYDSKRDRWAAA